MVKSRRKWQALCSRFLSPLAILLCLTRSFQFPFPSLSMPAMKASVDCEQSLFSSKVRGKERKTSMRANVTVSVTYERRCREPLAAWALEDERTSPNAHATSGSRHRRSHVTRLLRSFPRILFIFIYLFIYTR